MILLFNVLRDYCVRHVAATDAEVPARPHVTTPEFLPQVCKLVHQLERILPFQHLEQTADCHLRRNRDEQMDMIFRDVPFHDRDFVVAADFADQLSDPQPDFTCQHWLAVLRDPDDVQVNLERGVRAAPVIFHGGASYTTGAALHTC